MKKILAIILTMLSIQAFAVTAITPVAPGETPILFGATAVDSAGGNSVSNLAENVLLYFKQTGNSTATVTITAQHTSFSAPNLGNLTKANITQAIAAGAEYIIGPFPAAAYNDANGLLQITYTGSSTANLNIGAYAAPKLMKIP